LRCHSSKARWLALSSSEGLMPGLGAGGQGRGDRPGECLGRRRPGLDHGAVAVALEPVPDVAALLEVARERCGDERPARRDELHAGGQAALHERDVAGGQVPVLVGCPTSW
jgi:hypothetical protein